MGSSKRLLLLLALVGTAGDAESLFVQQWGWGGSGLIVCV